MILIVIYGFQGNWNNCDVTVSSKWYNQQVILYDPVTTQKKNGGIKFNTYFFSYVEKYHVSNLPSTGTKSTSF